MFAQIKNNQVVQWPIYSLTALFPNTSFPFPITADSVPEGYVMVGSIKQPTAAVNQKIVAGQPVQENGQWVQSWIVVNMTAEEVAERNLNKALDVRAERDTRLRNDIDTLNPLRWEAFSPEQQTAWRNYRQALLDLPQQTGFPFMINWPIFPA